VGLGATIEATRAVPPASTLTLTFVTTISGFAVVVFPPALAVETLIPVFPVPWSADSAPYSDRGRERWSQPCGAKTGKRRVSRIKFAMTRLPVIGRPVVTGDDFYGCQVKIRLKSAAYFLSNRPLRPADRTCVRTAYSAF